MIQMDRETLMMVATVVAIAGIIFLFREMNKAKADVENLKNFSAQIVHHLSNPQPMMVQQTPEPTPVPVPKPEVKVSEPKKEE